MKLNLVLLGLQYKSRGFPRKLRPDKLLHGHKFVNFQQILVGFSGKLLIGFEKVYYKYHYD